MNQKTNIDINNALEKLRNLPAKKRIEALCEHPNRQALLQAMTPPDLLMTIETVGGENALELLELLEPKQVQGLLDFAIWDNDQLDLDKTGHWLALLFEANPDRAIEQIDGLDLELVGLMFKVVADIYDVTLGEEPYEDYDMVSKSFDNRFIICFKNHGKYEGLARAMHRYIEMLYGVDMKRALHFLEQVRFDLASGLMESSFKLRDGRLLDLGILPRDERLAYFATININQIKKVGLSPQIGDELHQSFPFLVQIKNIGGQQYPFLARALADASHKESSIFFDSLVHASLNMHASLSGDFGNPGAFLLTIEYVKTLAEYGLAQASEGQLNNAATILRANDIKTFVRLGRTALVNMRKILKNALTDKSLLLGANFERADSPLREVARALMLPEPRYYEGLLNAKKLTFRFFGSLVELNATLKAINEMRFRAKLLGPEILGCDDKALEGHQTLSHSNIYARYVINNFLGNADALSALNARELKRVIGANKQLTDAFVDHAKRYAAMLAKKLADQGYFSPDQALEMSNNFSNAVLIQLEQNPELLLG